MTISLKNVVGWSSALSIVLAYFLLSFAYVSSTSLAYNALQLLGGVGLAWRVYQDRNYSNFVLELVFISIAIHALLT